MNPAVRERLWKVVSGWFDELGGGSLVMVWREAGLAGGLGIKCLGVPPRGLIDVEGIVLSKG
jgi:CRISPR-associated protein Cas2